MEQKKSNGKSRLRPIELSFQPVFDIHLNMAIDYEISMRINDKTVGVILPELFIPIAEKSSQICQLGLWAIEECCDVIKRCEAREADVNTFIVWISVKHICKKNFVAQVMKILNKHEIKPDRFCLNITQSILEADKDQILANIKELRELGFKVSIDDLGLEYTSLSNLSHYDVDYIGIHASLIEDILESERTQNMIQGLIDFAKKIEVETRVDGIDSAEKAELLKKMGVDQLKGPFYGKPGNEKSIV
ncbi:MAG: EAL domain-containing protein [Clostridia bacterium]|nr:EAL domain-containing protein [Clostridia bacterium]